MLDSPVLPSASVCMWWLVCSAPFQVLLAFTSPSVSHGVTLSFSLSLSLSQTERREKGVWTSRSWNTESSLSAFFIWFPSSMHTEHIIPLYIFIFKVGVFKERCALCPAQFFTPDRGIQHTPHMHALKLPVCACFSLLWVIKSNQCRVFSLEKNKV